MPIQVTHVASRDLAGKSEDKQGNPTNNIPRVSSEPMVVAEDPQVDVLVETLGGMDTARQVVLQALQNGKHVVTANKALIAEHGNELFDTAQCKERQLLFESAVAAGIPIIKVLREGLAANRIHWLAGIVNGTGNYILSAMAAADRPFAEVLSEAQCLGYAEADPAFDVEGTDAAHKLTIMAAIAFGIPIQFPKTYTEGISRITPEDMVYAKELGYRIKHLGIARHTPQGVSMRVHPALLPAGKLLAQVDGVGNAIMVSGSATGTTLYNGPGAGADATASAVVADLMDIGRNLMLGSEERLPALGSYELDNSLPVLTIDDIEAEYYLRIPARDKVGVMAHISGVLEAHAISIEAVIQKEAVSETVPIVILSHRTSERRLNEALAVLQGLDDVCGPIMRIRVETLEDE